MATWERWKGWIRVAIWLAAYLLSCGAFIVARHGSLLLSLLAVAAVIGSALQIQARARDLARSLNAREKPLFKRLLVPGILIVFGAGLVLAWWLGNADGLGFFGVAVLYVGFGLTNEQLRDQQGFAERWGPIVLALAALVAVVGFGLAALTSSDLALKVGLAGVLLTPIGLSLVSGRVNRSVDLHRGWLALVGVVAFVVAVGWMAALGVSGLYVAFIGGGIFVLMLAVASRSNADVVLVIAMAALVWTLTARTVPTTDAVIASDGENVFVALGDSYISGEGADEFYEGTNDKGQNECRRAPTAYPALLALGNDPSVPHHVAFLACSGATTEGIEQHQLPQLHELRQDNPNMTIDFVLLSVGGNDALFGSVGRTCILPGNCADLGPAWTANLTADVAPRLDELYAQVKAEVGDTPVLVVPYPVPINRERCADSVFTAQEHVFLHDFTVELNRTVAREAAKAGFQVVDTMPDALVNHRLCDGDPAESGVNFLAANTVAGTLEQTVSPLNWLHNSLHPNPRGHELMRDAVLTWLDDHPDLSVVAAPQAPDDNQAEAPQVTDTAECVGKTSNDLDDCTGAWQREQLASFVFFPGAVGLLAAIGAWLMAIGLIHVWRFVFADDSSSESGGRVPPNRPG